MPERASNGHAADAGPAPVRSFWSGVVTFGLVSIPVDLYSGVRSRQTSMKMVDKSGNPLGRQYHCSKDGQRLSQDDLVRGYETAAGDMIVITDEEIEALAPQTSRDIELRTFVPLEQISSMYFQRPYFLAPAGRSVKAYHLLAATMQRTERVAIGSLVMRGQEYLIAIISDGGVLRAETLRHFDELRTPESIGLPERIDSPARKVDQLSKEVGKLVRDQLEMTELEDRDAEALRELAESKYERGQDVIEQAGLEEEIESEGQGAQIVDLMDVLKRSLSKDAVVKAAGPKTSGTRSAREHASQRSRHPARRETAARRAAGSRRASRAGGSRADLSGSSRSELYRKAAELEIPGRSKMDKGELIRAIQAAR